MGRELREGQRGLSQAGGTVLFLALMAGVMLAVLYAVSAQRSARDQLVPAPVAKDERPCLRLVAVDDSDEERIKGRIANDCDRSYRYAEVEFRLYDKVGAVVGTAMTNITSIGPRDTWRFEALATRPYRQYRLDHIRGD